jgi:putative transposase
VPRLARSVVSGGLFHVVCRGVARSAICRDETDYSALIKQLQEVAQRFDWNLIAYCLMPNHYHLLVEADQEQLSAGMHRLNGLYAQRFNRRHDRVGHLFQERFWSRAIESEEQFSRAVTYVAFNPVEAGLCRQAGDWPWSASVYEPD